MLIIHAFSQIFIYFKEISSQLESYYWNRYVKCGISKELQYSFCKIIMFKHEVFKNHTHTYLHACGNPNFSTFFYPVPLSTYIVIYMNYILPLFRKLVIINICLIISDIQIQVKQDVERMKMTIFCEISYQIFYFQYYFKIHIFYQCFSAILQHCECVGELHAM